MPRHVLLLLPLTVAVLVGAAAGDPARPADSPAQAVAGPAAVARDELLLPLEDPFPIRRMRATEAQIPDVLKQPDSGPLVRLPRGDFETRVQAAARVATQTRDHPRVTESRWKASLVGGDLVGFAELEVSHPSAVPAVLTLDPLRLALGTATWADGRSAVMGIPAGSTAAGVWVEAVGRDSLKFPWSLAGVAEPGERRFELRVPESPAASLELDLPTGQVPTVSAPDVLVTGPFPFPTGARRELWRFRFGGRQRLEFSVRSAGNPGVVASAVLKARYELAPGQLTATFEYELRPAKGTVGEWAFAVDPGLRVTDVEVNNRAGWVVEAPPTPGAPRTLRVTLRQPGAGGKVLISAAAAFPDLARPAGALLPVVRPLGANLDDETLTIRLASDVRPVNWSPGDYRLLDSDSRLDQSRELTLTGTLLPAGASRPFRQMPTVQLATPEAEFATVEQTAWRLDADRVSATVRVDVRVRRGALFHLTLKAPPGYAFSRVAATRDDLVASAEVVAGNVQVEFARPVVAGQSVELTFEFVGPRLVQSEQQLAFPAFTPLRAAERLGVLGVLPGAVWAAEVRPGVGTLPAGWFTLDPPLPPEGALIAFRYRSDDPNGTVTLAPVRSEFTVEATVRAEPIPAGVEAAATFGLRVARGGLSSVAVRETAAGGGKRMWRISGGGNAITAAVPVPAGLFAGPLAFLARGDGDGLVWFLRLARPVTGVVVLETTATVPAGSTLPELSVIGASATRVVSVPSSGYAGRTGAAAWGFADLYHVTAVRTPRDVVVVFGGTVTAAGGSFLPISLPDGAEVRAALVGNRWVEPGGLVASAGGLRLPVATAPSRFEIRYRLPVEPGSVAREVRSPVPVLPGVGAEVRRWWSFGPEVLPGWPVRAWDRESADELPTLLGDSLAVGAGAVVWRSPVGAVRVATARAADAAGVALAALLFGLAWAGGRRRHPAAGLLVVAGLLVIGAALALGPPWWQRAALVPLVVGLLAAAGMVVVRGYRTRPLAAGTAAVAIWALSGSGSVAQPTVPAAVVLLPAGADGREVVVAPKALLDRLASAARPAAPGVIVTAAEYTASADDSTARVTAKFTAHAFEDDSIASLPLADARLESVAVDGRAAFPSAPRPGIYTVSLPTRGPHEIEVRFTVPVTGTGTEREFRFGVPESPAAKVTADLPGSARQPQVVGRVGRQLNGAGERVRLETYAGAVRAVQVRWRDGAGGTAALKVREGCVWDVNEDGAELTACYIVRVDQGAVSTLNYEIPAELDVLGVAARSLDAGGSAALRDWSLAAGADGFRPLRLDFQTPTAGRVLVALTLAPREPLTRQPALRFPKVVGATGEPDAVYGLRVKGVVVEDLVRGGVIDYPPDALTRDFATDLRLDPQTPVRVFRPTSTGLPVLRLTLRVAREPAAFTLDTAWHLGPRRADAEGTVRWAGKDPLALVEFTLPAVKLTEVRGAEVASWAQTGPRVQVWLKRPTTEGELAWSATVSPAAGVLDAQTPRPVGGPLAASSVRLAAAAGFAVRVERGQGWTPDEQDAAIYRTANPAAPPVRVAVVTVPPVLRDDELGWLAPRPKLTPAVAPTPTPPAPPVVSAGPTDLPAVTTTGPASRWLAPVTVVIAWCLTGIVLAVLLVRSPGTTWPEQVGLLGALFGTAIAGGWWAGLLAWSAARAGWLLEVAGRRLR